MHSALRSSLLEKWLLTLHPAPLEKAIDDWAKAFRNWTLCVCIKQGPCTYLGLIVLFFPQLFQQWLAVLPYFNEDPSRFSAFIALLILHNIVVAKEKEGLDFEVGLDFEGTVSLWPSVRPRFFLPPLSEIDSIRFSPEGAWSNTIGHVPKKKTRLGLLIAIDPTTIK